MYKLKTRLKSIVLLAIIIVAVTSNANAQKKIEEEFAKHTPYPDGFTEQKSNILVITYDNNSQILGYEKLSLMKSLSKDLEKDFPKDYTGGYDFVLMSKDIEDLTTSGDKDQIFNFKVTDTAYSDINKYRYIFFYEGYLNMIGMTTIQNFRFGIFDRKNNTFAFTYQHSGSHGPLMEAYIKKLDEVRVK